MENDMRCVPGHEAVDGVLRMIPVKIDMNLGVVDRQVLFEGFETLEIEWWAY